MKFTVNHIPLESKWAMATQGLTGALSAHLNALYAILGKARYAETVREIWAMLGQGCAEGAMSMGLPRETARQVAQAGATFCMCAMGPELKIEEHCAGDDRAVMKIVECPWKNRMDESGITNDVLTDCDAVFWQHFVKTLNPEVIMRHGKQMHRGDSYCEWIFEKRCGADPDS